MDDHSNIKLEENYYTFLNLPRDATLEQIQAAYRRLSRMYHPDKHNDPDSKQKAEMLFTRTKRAYEVLSDPQTRAIYDSVGERGLRTDGWEVSHRTKTPAEIREEFQLLAQAAEERKLQQSTNPRGDITIKINAKDIFAPQDETYFPQIEVASMGISQSIQAPVTLKDTLILSGELVSSNGIGNGGFVLSGRRLLNKAWVQLDVGAGNGPLLGLRGGRTLMSMLRCNGGTSLALHESYIYPSLFATLAYDLNKHVVATVALNSGSQTSVTLQIDSNTERNEWRTSLVIGSPHIYFNVAYARKMIDNDLKLKVSAKIGTLGFLVEYGAGKKISENSSVQAAVSFGVPSGVMLKFKLVRFNQSYTLPIFLSEEILPAAVFYGSVLPIFVWLFVKKSIIDPMKAERRRLEIEKLKRNNAQKIAAKKAEAAAAIQLMRNTYERILAEEKNRGGLVITRAIYGADIEADDDDDASERHSIDVTIPLQCLVRVGVLKLHGETKSELPGFYDPCIGEEKLLKIKYKWNNQSYSVVVKDTESVRLPPQTERN